VAAAACAAALCGAAVPAARAADAPYVPTPANVVDAMLGIAQVGPRDFVIDLGSGDGRIVIAAAKKYGARGFGVDIDGALVSQARREAKRQGVADRVEFHTRNLFITEIGEATVLTMYLYPQIIMRLRPRLFAELKPGTRVVSHDFDMDNWRPDDKITVPVPDKPYGAPKSDIFLWIIPANAAGRWQWRMTVDGVARDYELTLEQTFQMLKGAPLIAGTPARFEGGRLRGEQIDFTLIAEIDGRAVRHEFSGRVAGDAISGRVTVRGAAPAQAEWSATRVARGKIDVEANLPLQERRILIAEEQK
jgi:hypothetical protein